jgi:protein TonB
VPAPKPVEQEPLASRRLVAPVAPTTNAAERDGAIQARADNTSQGSGVGGGTGTGRGTGDGEGLGSGIGPGSGGGTGGGPYRAGSGVTPPRLLREVKATYTDEARRRGVTGNVILEIVIARDGTVSDVSVRRGLGGGLDERAIAAVRQWKFAPARRLGEPVDVIVEVAVEFTLR